MLLLLIFLLLIFFMLKNNKIESFNEPQLTLPDLSDKNLVDSLEILNNRLSSRLFENKISYFYDALKKYNYFSYGHSADITVLIPLNSSLTQYFSWIMTDLDEINKSPEIVNNCFILGNIFNDSCIINNSHVNCGPFTKDILINKSNSRLFNSDFIISDLHYKDGIIHIVDFLLENSNDVNFIKKDYFTNYSREERESHLL